jgi:MoxR-like ATPase
MTQQSQTGPHEWWIYRNTREPLDGAVQLPAPPPWRPFADLPPEEVRDPDDYVNLEWPSGRVRQARAYQADKTQKDLVNMALYLRRPLLISGPPGVGKSTLAYSVAYELKLGPVLRWPISSRSTLKEGLYDYDAIGRLGEVNLKRESQEGAGRIPDIGKYLRLGPLGTALLPGSRPRVLLIDEIDKCDIDLPGDLLSVFEDGEYKINELARLDEHTAAVETEDHKAAPVTIKKGLVRCVQFPFIVLTSNEDREFPRAFLRRCLRLRINPPGPQQLERMARSLLENAPEDVVKQCVHRFLKKRDGEGSTAVLANDQLLNALMMAVGAPELGPGTQGPIDEHVLKPLDQA